MRKHIFEAAICVGGGLLFGTLYLLVVFAIIGVYAIGTGAVVVE